MLHEPGERNHAIIRIASDMSFVMVCNKGDLGFYSLLTLYDDTQHKTYETEELIEVFERGPDAVAYAEEMEHWG